MRRIRAVASVLLRRHHQWVEPSPVRFPILAQPPSSLLPHPHFQCSIPGLRRLSSVLDDSDGESHSDTEDAPTHSTQLDPAVAGDVNALVQILLAPQPRSEMKRDLDQCAATASPELVTEVLSRVRNDWEAAFTFFLWAGKRGGYSHSLRDYHSMISILGKMRKFDTAWSLVDEMAASSLVTWQTLMIMIRRYCAAHDVARAISSFYAHKRFRLHAAGTEEFQGLLSALCRYKNVKDAEHLLFCNGEAFPFNTKSFNIVLNGWCNVIGSPREAQRIWWEMTQRSILHDVVSFASITSCYSKSGNLHKVLRTFDRMKELGVAPDRKVYNAVIFALAKARFVKEAVNLVRTMEEKGVPPNAVTYNSLIKPLCKARKVEEAEQAYDEMVRRGLSPPVQTYHAFFRALRTGEEVFALLDKMTAMGCEPDINTFIMLIRKFSRWRQLDDVFKVWRKMSEGGVSPDRSAYIVLIHGLFLNGKLEEAHKYYLEMREKQYLPEPRTEEMLRAWLAGKQQAAADVREYSEPDHQTRNTRSEKLDQQRRLLREPEARKVVRERGISFWDR